MTLNCTSLFDLVLAKRPCPVYLLGMPPSFNGPHLPRSWSLIGPFLFVLFSVPFLHAHDVDLPGWVRDSTACILDVYNRTDHVEIVVDFRRPDALRVLDRTEWSERVISGAMIEKLKSAIFLNGRNPEKVERRTDSAMYERWVAVWAGPFPASFGLRAAFFDHLAGLGWCQVFVVPEAGGKPEQSFFFKGDQEFTWPRTLTMPGMTWGRFFHLGYVHILPRGLDHILFVLGLCLAASSLARLFIQITAFTAAHTLTLGLASKGWVSLSPSVVEPLIAASIVWIAFENTRKGEPPSWRWIPVFAFGLVHGLGFAGILLDSGLPAGLFLSSLFAFNLGVEAGQLTVVGVVLSLLWRIRKMKWYRSRVLIPGSLLIGAAGAFWTLERVLSAFP